MVYIYSTMKYKYTLVVLQLHNGIAYIKIFVGDYLVWGGFNLRRIAVFTDIHGNIDALETIYNDIVLEGISEVYHLGDAIAIGPDPKATLDFILDKGIISLKGNHEIYYTDIIRTGSADVSDGELIHQQWVANKLGKSYFESVNNFDYDCVLDSGGVKIYFCHYPFIKKEDRFNKFIDFDKEINSSLFSYHKADLYVFGHQHNGSDKIDGNGIRYINLSSAGATRGNETTYIIIQIQNNSFEVTMKNIIYNKSKVVDKIDQLEVPDRDFIKRIFFGID